MFMLQALMSPNLLRNALTGNIGKPDCVVDNFPEYATDVRALPVDQQRQVRQLAQVVFHSLPTSRPVRSILVVGHADTALRKSGLERTRTEIEVSVKRAASGRKAIMAELERIAGHPSVEHLLICRGIGVGATRKVVASARTESDMRKNRRVEYYLIFEHLNPPVCNH